MSVLYRDGSSDVFGTHTITSISFAASFSNITCSHERFDHSWVMSFTSASLSALLNQAQTKKRGPSRSTSQFSQELQEEYLLDVSRSNLDNAWLIPIIYLPSYLGKLKQTNYLLLPMLPLLLDSLSPTFFFRFYLLQWSYKESVVDITAPNVGTCTVWGRDHHSNVENPIKGSLYSMFELYVPWIVTPHEIIWLGDFVTPSSSQGMGSIRGFPVIAIRGRQIRLISRAPHPLSSNRQASWGCSRPRWPALPSLPSSSSISFLFLNDMSCFV